MFVTITNTSDDNGSVAEEDLSKIVNELLLLKPQFGDVTYVTDSGLEIALKEEQ